MFLIIIFNILFIWDLLSLYSVIRNNLDAEACARKYTSPSIPPSGILDVDTWIFIQSCHPLSSEGEMHAPSSARCDPPASASTSQTFPSSSSSLLSCMLIPKTVTARKTFSRHLSPFIPLIPCLSRPSLYLCHYFPPLLGASSPIPGQVSLLQCFFQLFPEEGFGPFWASHVGYKIVFRSKYFFSLKKSTLQQKLQFIKA